MKKDKILIVGSGLAGLSAVVAKLVAKHMLDVEIVDPSDARVTLLTQFKTLLTQFKTPEAIQLTSVLNSNDLFIAPKTRAQRRAERKSKNHHG